MNLAFQKSTPSCTSTLSTKQPQRMDPHNQTRIAFGASSSDNFEHFLHHAGDKIEEGAEEFVIAQALSAGVANSNDYRKLDKYKNIPPQIAQGEVYLRMATSAENPKPACKLAEKEFVEAARSNVNIHKARGLRMAAIAAKLRGDNEKARTYMDYSKSLNSSENLEQDKHNLEAECNFLANKMLNPVKRGLLAPIRFIEGVARVVVGEFAGEPLEDEPHYFTTRLTSPFQVELDKTKKELIRHHISLYTGQASDDEWIDGKDRVKEGRSTGKGLRHSYRSIEIAEEKRIEAQKKAAEEVRQAAEAAKKAEAQRKAAEESRKAEEAKQVEEAAKRAEEQRKAAEEARQAECCKKTSYGIVAVIAMLWGLAALGKQNA